MARTGAQTTLKSLGITMREISTRSGVHELTVANALHPERFHGVRYRELFQVRRAVEAAMREKGADPRRGRIWEEYDALVPDLREDHEAAAA